MKIVELTKETRKDLLDHLLKRSPNHYGGFEESVQEIVNSVKEKRDEALFSYTEQFDKVKITKRRLR